MRTGCSPTACICGPIRESALSHISYIWAEQINETRWTRCQQATCVWVGPSHLPSSTSERLWGDRYLSTLLWGEEGERTGDESLPQVVYWSTVGHYISALVKCTDSASALLICMEMISFETNSFPAVQSVIMVSKRKKWSKQEGMRGFIVCQLGRYTIYSALNWFWFAGDIIFLWLTWESEFILGRA